jgi:hypothetical protein
VYNPRIHQLINKTLQQKNIDIVGKDNLFYTRFVANAATMHLLYSELYGRHPQQEKIFIQLVDTIAAAYIKRP